MTDWTFLKQHATKRLDAAALAHPLGHQNVYANRYILRTRRGTDLEVMLEKGPKSPANIWLAQSRLLTALIGAVKHRLSPASKLRAKRGKNGTLLYGRHSALEKMPELGDADLICFAPDTLAELDLLLDHLAAL